ncbi:aldo/keto reductase [Thermomonospora umbrina]|uniref:Diketogulonate reductase-like aldo/keto reductase n=1 Tax=Thermomonospora umbrina TaxID=111806 RepID=A0A3D9SII4_9ACTN|nr:aldo/keto reductase [Thermomonospora umbrina]REE95507.1 diketogulonate reductase-like aldo/keto reductase [Thermomonospora umbrina]
MTVPNIVLNNGVPMPQLGYGVWQVEDAEAEKAVATALDAGYRSIDTAALYYNEQGVGRAVRSSDVPREELFLTTKLWNTEHEYDRALAAFDQSMGRLGLDVLDLYLIHWPVPAQDRYMDAWRALERLYRDGRVRAIGVSNFTVETLTRLLDEGDVPPAVNQIELHPTLAQAELRAFHRENGIATEAWSPLGQGRGLLEEPTLVRLSAAHGRTPAQIVLRWHLQLGNIVIPKSVTPSRIAENLDVFGFELSPEDMAEISALDVGRRLGPDPATMSF